MTSKRGVVRKGKYAPIHFLVEVLTRPGSNEKVRALVALDDTARRQCAERKLSAGSIWKAEIKQPRNLEFWRLAHALGGWLVDNHEMFEGLDSHAAIKHIQALSKVGCNAVRYRVEDPTGKYTIVRFEPLSLAFDLMDEGEFRTYWDGGAEARGNGGWVGWIRKNLYPDLNRPTVDQIEQMIVGKVVQWAG